MGGGHDIVDLGLEEVKAGIRDGSILLVDVREPQETAAGIIPGSHTMPLSGFDPAALPDPGEARLVFSCAAGVRSRLAVEAARRAGLSADAHFAGGFKEWMAAGEPVVRPQD